MNKTVLTLAMAALFTAQANAQTLTDVTGQKPTTTAQQAAADLTAEPVFGTYVAVSGVKVVNAATASSSQAVATLGSQRIVADSAAAASNVIREHSVVRNLVTGELAVLTGRVSVLTNDVAALNAAISALGLKSVKSIKNGKLQMLQATAETDLVALKGKLEQIKGVRTVRLDLLENRHKPQ